MFVALYAYKFPELGEGIHEGEIVKLLIQPGDIVTDESILMEVQNDKAVVEVPCPVEGKVTEILVKEGQVCTVGDIVAHIEVVDASMPAEQQHAASPAVHSQPSQQAGQQTLSNFQHHAPSQASLQANVGVQQHAPSQPVVTGLQQQVPSQQVTSAPTFAMSQVATVHEILATPSVRKLAREHGVALQHIQPSGKHGHVTRDDILRFTSDAFQGSQVFVEPDARVAIANAQVQGTNAQGTSANAQGTSTTAQGTSKSVQFPDAPLFSSELREERIPFKGIRKIIANAMTKSMYTAPHVTLMDEVEVSGLVDLREKAKAIGEQRGVKLTYLPFIVKALTTACRQFPVMNAMIDEEKQEIVYKKYYHIGIATDTDNGLLVPVISHADQRNIWSIASAIKDLSTRARDGKLAATELRGSTITITNIGSVGGMFFTPVINFPEVAILGVGRISEKPIVKDGQIVIGKMMALSLSFDHRLVDGATAQSFLNVVKQYLADPALLILEV